MNEIVRITIIIKKKIISENENEVKHVMKITWKIFNIQMLNLYTMISLFNLKVPKYILGMNSSL